MARSWRATLLLWQLPVIAVLLAVGVGVDFWAARDHASSVHDMDLVSAAGTVASWVKEQDGKLVLEVPPNGIDALAHEHGRAPVYRVIGPDGSLLGGEQQPFVPHATATPKPGIAAIDATLSGRDVRLVTLPFGCRAGECRVEIAELAADHDRLRDRVFLYTFVPELLLGLLVLASLWIGGSRAVRPIERLSRELQARAPDDLQPLQVSGIPRELMPLVNEMNYLLARLSDAMRAQRDFSTNAAHQLRTPIAVLQARAELASNMPMSEELRVEIHEIHEATLRTARLSAQLLSLARSTDPDWWRNSVARVDLKDVIDDIANESVHLAIAKDIDLGFEIASARVNGDRGLLGEAIVNVVTNAIHYTPANGEVTVRCSVRRTQALVEVEDNGPGIPRAERERVKERFYRVPGTPGTGSGLGLPIVQKIVADHGGTMSIVDATKGRGCLIRLAFPLADDA